MLEKFKTHEDEEFRQVEDYPDYYISNYGTLVSFRKNGQPRVKKVYENSPYALAVLVSSVNEHKNIYVHRLVAQAFIPNPDGLSDVNHIDENKRNNYYKNLEWCSHKYNCNYGNRVEKIREKNNRPILELDKEGFVIREFESLSEVSKEYDLNISNLSQYLQGKRRSGSGGHILRYKYHSQKQYKK